MKKEIIRNYVPPLPVVPCKRYISRKDKNGHHIAIGDKVRTPDGWIGEIVVIVMGDDGKWLSNPNWKRCEVVEAK